MLKLIKVQQIVSIQLQASTETHLVQSLHHQKQKKCVDFKYPQSKFWCLDATENKIFLKLEVLLAICLK